MSRPIKRRHFIETAAMVITGACATTAGSKSMDYVMTVQGKVSTDELGLVLPHEHIIVDFVGAEYSGPHRYDADKVFQVALPQLERARDMGMQTFVDCTPAYMGRDPELLKRLSTETGVHILTNTGCYGAGKHRYVSSEIRKMSADEIAAKWVHEWQHGLDDTGIRPGFIKIGVDNGPLTNVTRKIVRAAARTHLATGMTIGAHTVGAEAIREEVAILEDEGVDPSALIWIHAQSQPLSDVHYELAQRGVWIEFDILRHETVAQYQRLLHGMKSQGLLDHVLVSHDAGWYHVGEPGGGEWQPFDTLFLELLPLLRESGFTEEELHQLTVTNPAEAFAMRVRKV